MKIRYFKTIQIDVKVLLKFLRDHPPMMEFVHAGEPFYVRVSKKLYPGLIHCIVSQDEDNANTIAKWNQLNDFAKKMKPNRVNDLTVDILYAIFGKEKGKLIKQISKDIVEEKLDLKQLAQQSEQTIIDTLNQYPNLSINTIKTFALFSCFKQNVLCEEDPDFKKGLQIFLKKQNITQEDINNIKIEYEGQLTLFSLCIWKIKNERVGN